MKMGAIFILKEEYNIGEMKQLDECETRKLIIKIIESKGDLKSLETGDTTVRLINNGRTIEVRKTLKISFYEVK
jgi:hypothetical protein